MKPLLFLLTIALFCSCNKQEKEILATKPNKTIEENKDSLIVSPKKSKDSIEKIEYNSYIYKDEEIAKIPKPIIAQLSENFSVIDVDFGYLNDDNFTDYIVAIKQNDEQIDENGDAPKRKLLIFAGQKSGKFVLAKINEKNAVLDLNHGANHDDPFLGVSVGKNNSFLIEHGVGSGNQHWTRFTNFKYDKKLKNWILTKNELTIYSEHSEEGLKLDEEYGLPINFHELKTQKDFGIVEFENFENK